MASKTQALFLLFSLFTFSSFLKPSLADGQIAVYWGQNTNEGTLRDTCDSGNYEMVLLAFLNVFGAGRTPALNFAGHCGDQEHPCTELAPEIQHCQSKNIKVMLSIGGAGDYSIASADDAKEVAKYLLDNFLSDQSGPLGSVSLDGIDFFIAAGSSRHWDDLAKELHNLRQQRHFSLAATPQCFIPDYYLDGAIKTGLFDYVFVRFYNNPPCQFSSRNPDNLFRSWEEWNTLVPSSPSNGAVFLGLPAAPNVAPTGGYISPEDMKSTVLPHVQESAKYGGVMLWNRYYDTRGNEPPYSEQIRPVVLQSVVKSAMTIADAIYKCASDAILGLMPRSLAL